MPKANGKLRLICVPTVVDRIVQRALLDFLSIKYDHLLANSINYGFIRGRTVEAAARRAISLREKHPWIYKTDITSFFDRISRPELVSRMGHVIRERSLHPLLKAAVSCEVATERKTIANRIKALGIAEGMGVRQGMPLSPFFANVVLQLFDAAIYNGGYRAVRYADDLIFFCDSEQECIKTDAFCRNELEKLGLSIPTVESGTKSIICEPEHTAEFLGLGLCYHNGKHVLRVLPKQIEAIRKELLQLSSISELLARSITLGNLQQAIRSRVSGYRSAYEACTNADELDNALDSLQQLILRRVYRDGIKIDLASLSAEARTFLGLH